MLPQRCIETMHMQKIIPFDTRTNSRERPPTHRELDLAANRGDILFGCKSAPLVLTELPLVNSSALECFRVRDFFAELGKSGDCNTSGSSAARVPRRVRTAGVFAWERQKQWDPHGVFNPARGAATYLSAGISKRC